MEPLRFTQEGSKAVLAQVVLLGMRNPDMITWRILAGIRAVEILPAAAKEVKNLERVSKPLFELRNVHADQTMGLIRDPRA